MEEQTIFEVHPSIKQFAIGLIVGFLLLIVPGLILLLYAWIRVKFTTYRLTTQRFFIIEGLLSRTENEIELFRVKDVSVRQSFFQRLFGIGSVQLLSTDDSNPVVNLIGVPDPIGLKEMIRTHSIELKRKMGLRATEFIES